MLFAVLTWQVACHGPLRTLDERLGRALATGSLPAGAAEFCADLGNTAVALPVLLVVMVWAGWLGWRRQRERHGAGQGGEDADQGPAPVRWWLPPLAAGLALAVVPALVVPLKLWIARPGPPQMTGDAPAFYPSGHGATAAVAYGAVGLLLIHSRRGMRTGDGAAPARPHPPTAPATTTTTTTTTATVTVAVTVAVVLLNVGVGIGLVRRGYHWPLDVLGSWCLAGVLLAAWCAVCDRWSAGSGGRAVRRRTSGGPGADGV